MISYMTYISDFNLGTIRMRDLFARVTCVMLMSGAQTSSHYYDLGFECSFPATFIFMSIRLLQPRLHKVYI